MQTNYSKIRCHSQKSWHIPKCTHSADRKAQSVICKESEKVQSDRFSILIPLPFLRLSLADATRAKNLGSCSNL